MLRILFAVLIALSCVFTARGEPTEIPYGKPLEMLMQPGWSSCTLSYGYLNLLKEPQIFIQPRPHQILKRHKSFLTDLYLFVFAKITDYFLKKYSES